MYITPVQGLARYVSNIKYQPGCSDPFCKEQNFSNAISAAAEADAVVILVGLSLLQEEEGLDRDSLLLPGNQQELVSNAAKAAKGPVVLVIISGGPVDVSFAKEDPSISSIIWAGYPGQAGGQAIAQIIFGDCNPGTPQRPFSKEGHITVIGVVALLPLDKGLKIWDLSTCHEKVMKLLNCPLKTKSN